MAEFELVICFSLTIYVSEGLNYIITFEGIFWVVHSTDRDRHLSLREN